MFKRICGIILYITLYMMISMPRGAKIGHIVSQETRDKISRNQSGGGYFLGGHHSKEAREKIRLAHLAEKNANWAGYDAKIGYAMLHRWVKRRIPKPELCPDCKLVPPYDLANITGVYNRDLHNWKYLCRRCHKLFDRDHDIHPPMRLL